MSKKILTVSLTLNVIIYKIANFNMTEQKNIHELSIRDSILFHHNLAITACLWHIGPNSCNLCRIGIYLTLDRNGLHSTENIDAKLGHNRTDDMRKTQYK